jgi:HTH-type transcriptional regulator/antitoxin HigA
MNAVLAEAFPAGEFLADELEARGWTQAEFAAILDRPAQFVSEIISGKKEITRESAAQIGAALGTSAEMWLSLQDKYFLWKQNKDTKAQSDLDDVRRRARLNEKGPIAILRKAGVLTSKSLDDLEGDVLRFFELKSLDEEPRLAAAAKRSNHGESLSSIQTSWMYMVRHAAREEAPTGTYSRKALEAIGAELPRVAMTPEDFAALPEMLGEAGVRLVYVPGLPGAKIDGCAMIVDKTRVIGLSGRGKRLDKVLFALIHEIAHHTHGHVRDDAPIVETIEVDDDPNDQSDEATQEREANDTAARWVLPKGLPPLPERLSGPWVLETAAQIGIAPIMFVGHLQHLKKLDLRTTLAKGAPNVDDVLSGWDK